MSQQHSRFWRRYPQWRRPLWRLLNKQQLHMWWWNGVDGSSSHQQGIGSSMMHCKLANKTQKYLVRSRYHNMCRLCRYFIPQTWLIIKLSILHVLIFCQFFNIPRFSSWKNNQPLGTNDVTPWTQTLQNIIKTSPPKWHRSWMIQSCRKQYQCSGPLPVINGILNPYKWPFK